MEKRIWLELGLFVALALIVGAYVKGHADGKTAGIGDAYSAKLPGDAVEKTALLRALRIGKLHDVMLTLEKSLDEDIAAINLLLQESDPKSAEYTAITDKMRHVDQYRKDFPVQPAD